MTDQDGVYALRYAYRTASVRGEHFYGHDDRATNPWPIDYFVWAICRGDDVTLFDAGFSRAEAARRGRRPYLGTPAELIGRLGFRAGQVSTVVLSHLHYDHTGTLADFPAATVVLQRAEYDFWRSPLAARGGYRHLLNAADLAELERRERRGLLRLVDGDWTLDPAVTGHLVGGHTAGLQVLRVATTPPVVLAADASHFYDNIDCDHPYAVVHELAGMYAAFDRVRALAGERGVVVPGHDPAVKQRHPALPGQDGLIHPISYF
ncbi:N-acyl homoserine lactonase family protein [Saccharomonospora piscinae]|uniref:N-acyl homoserine lactonase family protein n=1 Tax=Saccharomonospora piscinae TaxID=687388 RepID=UPI000465CC36|nr:N-acyl homoserine lactonase family protein [Saccharomonospora piscinae]